MARGHVDLPTRVEPLTLSKRSIYRMLKQIDDDQSARARVLQMETGFKRRIISHLDSLPTSEARFQKFNTSPFVLMFYSRKRHYTRVSEIEGDIIPAKIFS